MRKIIIGIVFIFTFSTLIANPSLGETIKVGGLCSINGKISGNFICQKSGTRILWVKRQTLQQSPSDYITPKVLAALKVTKLPSNLVPPIAKVPSDKSLWLDQPCSVDFADVKIPDCQAGNPKGSKIMVVYGDSHATMWMTA